MIGSGLMKALSVSLDVVLALFFWLGLAWLAYHMMGWRGVGLTIAALLGWLSLRKSLN